VALLEEQAATRIPDLVPVRHGRMLVSPFTFFRGAALVMAADLGPTPHAGVNVQLCGDAHLSNFGVFGSPERRLIFDINDFDETFSGPLGMGREAPGGQLRGSGSRAGLLPIRPSRRRHDCRLHVPADDAACRPDACHRCLV
jgi:hypothetical protein